MSSRSAKVLFVLSACAAACRFESSGISLRPDARRDAPTMDAPERLDRRGQDRQGPDRQRRETVLGVEGDCLDGVDDDGDQQIDCEDPDCAAGHECVGAAPPSMSGYYRVRETTWNDPVAPCADGGTPETHPSAPVPGACSPCACGPFGGAACGYPPIHSWTGGNCSGTATDVTATLGTSGCFSGKASGQVALKVVGAATPTNPGSCAASGGVAQHPPPFAKQLEACGSNRAGGGCGSKVCVPRAPAAVITKLCHRLSSGSCGAGWVAVVGHSGWKDDRTCAPCACTPGGVTCNGGKYTLYGNNQSCDGGGCSQPETIGLNDCRTFDAPVSTPYSVKAEAAKASGGSCTPSGGQPGGSVTSTPITYCCPP